MRVADAKSKPICISSSRSTPWSWRRAIDEMILFSGDGDFRSLVEAVQRRGVRVTVVSSIACQPAMLADELRRQADEFIDIKLLQQSIGRNPLERMRTASGER